jgi:hypothetical protein
MNEQVPFAVVGSREELVVNGHKVRARMYPWGTVEGKPNYKLETVTSSVKLRRNFRE